MKEKSSPSTTVPRQIQWPEGHDRELQIVDPTLLRPQLPPNWAVVERPRSRTARGYGHVDKYYIEPGTGRQFRSLVSVLRHLNGEPTCERSSSMTKNPAIRMEKLGHTLKYASAGFRLPEGWIIKKVPRRNSGSHTVDKYYIEPGTGYRFRSLVSVERYLKATAKGLVEPKAIEYTKQFTETNVAGQGSNLEIVPFRNHSTICTGLLRANRNKARLRNVVTEPKCDVGKRPEKVKWVLTGPGGNVFRPYMNGLVVPGLVREKWSEAFVSLIQN